jgi:hypothetical protein
MKTANFAAMLRFYFGILGAKLMIARFVWMALSDKLDVPLVGS